MRTPTSIESISSITANFDKVLDKTRRFFLGAADQPLRAHAIAEIEKRLAQQHSNPHNVVPWETVKAKLNVAFKDVTPSP